RPVAYLGDLDAFADFEVLGHDRTLAARAARTKSVRVTSLGSDVLVVTEHVGRIVRALQVDETVVLRAERPSHAIGALVADEVQVCALRREGLQVLTELLVPADVLLILSGVFPY